jgi:DNA-binding XRE family transcriptional regulator
MTANQFKMAKAALGLGNPEVAEMTGLHRNTLNKLDQGAGKASTVQHVRLALGSQRYPVPSQRRNCAGCGRGDAV